MIRLEKSFSVSKTKLGRLGQSSISLFDMLQNELSMSINKTDPNGSYNSVVYFKIICSKLTNNGEFYHKNDLVWILKSYVE